MYEPGLYLVNRLQRRIETLIISYVDLMIGRLPFIMIRSLRLSLLTCALILLFGRYQVRVIIIELTVPAEEDVADAHNRKLTKYASLQSDCISQGWYINFPN